MKNLTRNKDVVIKEMTSDSTKWNTTKYCLVTVTVICLVLFYDLAESANKKIAKSTADSLSVLMTRESNTLSSFDSTTTLDQYVIVAMERNQELRSAFNRWIADLERSNYEGALPDPMFSYSKFIENVETRVGPQEHRFSLRQSLPWFGTLGSKEDIAFAMSQVSYQKFEAERLQLMYEVKAAFYDYYYLGQDLLITDENLKLLEFWESVALSKYRVGLKQHPDIIKAQVELGKLEDHLRTLQEKQQPTSARLRALLNLPEAVALPIPLSISIEEAQLIKDSVKIMIKKNNPNLRAFQHLIEREQARERFAGKQALPSFSIGIDYIQTGEALNREMDESGKDPWMIGASITLPIWFGKNNARKKEAEARRQVAEYQFRDSENQVLAAAERVLFEYSDALRKTQLYRDGLVPKAQQSLNASYAAYEAGKTDFLNVLDAQRQLLDFQLTVVREQVRLATKRAQLEMLSGTELNSYLEQ